MEYLGKRADRFWRNARLRGEEMEEIIAELKRVEEERGNWDIESNKCAAEHAAVREAIAKGLLQPHGTPPNTKQDGILQLLCKNPNGLNSRITGNHKLSKAIDIKDELEANGLLYSEHRLNLQHKDKKNKLSKCFNRRLHARQLQRTTCTMGQAEFRREARGWWLLATPQGTSSRLEGTHID
jgi:hypothetical protein